MIQALSCHTNGKMKTIFVSSTFKDMHYERDAIRDITAPSLNEEAKKHGDELDFCDLRWGINTGDLDTEEGSKKVLDVCLDEIDRSEPPMVVLLGYRYGWMPDADLIKTAADRKQLKLEDLRKSVTALEIEYGALCDEKKFKNTLFYFREIEGDAPSDYLVEDREHEEKISALKNRIKSITGGKVKEYILKWNGSGFDGVDAFAGTLAEDIKDMLMPEWQKTENLTDFERERKTHAAFIREKDVMFRARQAEAEKLIKEVLSQPVTIIKGEVGSGKSTLFCHMTTELEKSEWTVLPFISGLTTESNSARDIIENTIYFIEEELHLDHYIDEADSQTGKKKEHTPEDWRNKLAEMCSAYTKTGAKLLIMVDAADQLAQSEERDKLHFIPMSVSEDIHFVMTCTTDFRTPGQEHYTLRQLNNEDKLDVISGILARSGREISKPVIEGMLGLEASDNPLYLSLLVQRLLMMNREDFADISSRGDGMTAIEQYQLELIRNKCPDSLDEMSAALLSEAGKRINEKLVSKAAQYLAVSRNGLRRKDMAALLGEEWTEIDFSHFVTYMYDCFLLRDDGRYDFMHKSIRAGFRGQCKDLDKVNREILEYFKSLETDDPVRMSEIIYHAAAADDKKFFVDYIIKYKDVSSIISHAARNIYAQCITDNGQWIIDVLHEAKKYEADEKLCILTDFCNFDLDKAFLRNQKELEIKLSILTANIDFSEYLYHKFNSHKSKRNLLFCYNGTADIYMVFRGNANIKLALELYEKSLTVSEQLDAEFSSPESKRDLAAGYDNVAGIHEELGDPDSVVYIGLNSRDNLKPALELYEKSLTIREQLAAELDTPQSKRDLAASYDNVARIYKKLGSRDDLKLPLVLAALKECKQLKSNDNLELALKLYEKSLTIREQLAAELGTPQSKRDLYASYHALAEIYEELGGSDNLKLALKLYEKSLTLREQLAAELGTAESKKELSSSYHGLAGIYEELGGSDNLKLALELREKDLTIREQLVKELGTSQSKRDLYANYYNVAELYMMLGSNDLMALLLYEKGLAINKEMAAELGTTESKRELYDNYTTVAGIYEALGGSDNLKSALELHKKSLEIREQLAKELDTAGIKDVLSLGYFETAETYEELGGSDNLKSALELYEKSLTLQEQLAAESGIAERKNALSRSYHKVAETYKAAGGNDNLKSALELCKKDLTLMEQLEKELGTPQSKGNLSVSYHKAAEIYEELGGSDNLKSALELYKKDLMNMEQLEKELGTAQSKENLSASYNKVAGIYKKLGGRDNLKLALELYEKSLTIREQLTDESGGILNPAGLYADYIHVAGILEKSDGIDNLAQALALYEKALEIGESKDWLNTTDACDGMAICSLKMAYHPSTPESERKTLLNRSLKMSMLLYEETRLDKYRLYVDNCYDAMLMLL